MTELVRLIPVANMEKINLIYKLFKTDASDI
jgi:hypothetical protein